MKLPYKVGDKVSLGRRSFIINNLPSKMPSRNEFIGIEIGLSRPYLDGKRKVAGYALNEEKILILKGFAKLEVAEAKLKKDGSF